MKSLPKLPAKTCIKSKSGNNIYDEKEEEKKEISELPMAMPSLQNHSKSAPNNMIEITSNNQQPLSMEKSKRSMSLLQSTTVNNNNNNNQKQHTIVYNNLNSIEQEENRSRQWSIIAIVCICLVIISIIVITYLSWTVCKERRKIYSMAPSSMISDNIQMIFPESNNSSFKQ
eukprot:501459_1